MREVARWRLVKDEPPPTGIYVLVWSDPIMKVATLDEEGVWWFADTRVIMDVTHWQILPFPPYTDGIPLGEAA